MVGGTDFRFLMLANWANLGGHWLTISSTIGGQSSGIRRWTQVIYKFRVISDIGPRPDGLRSRHTNILSGRARKRAEWPSRIHGMILYTGGNRALGKGHLGLRASTPGRVFRHRVLSCMAAGGLVGNVRDLLSGRRRMFVWRDRCTFFLRTLLMSLPRLVRLRGMAGDEVANTCKEKAHLIASVRGIVSVRRIIPQSEPSRYAFLI